MAFMVRWKLDPQCLRQNVAQSIYFRHNALCHHHRYDFSHNFSYRINIITLYVFILHSASFADVHHASLLYSHFTAHAQRRLNSAEINLIWFDLISSDTGSTSAVRYATPYRQQTTRTTAPYLCGRLIFCWSQNGIPYKTLRRWRPTRSAVRFLSSSMADNFGYRYRSAAGNDVTVVTR